MDLGDLQARLSERGEQFLADKGREHYLSGAGYKPAPELSLLYSRHADLFTLDNIRTLTDAAAAGDDDYTRRLRDFVMRERIAAGLAETDDALRRAEAVATLNIDGEHAPYRHLPARVAAEPDPERRHGLDEARRAIAANLNPLREERLRRLHAGARELGHATYEGVLLDVLGDRLSALYDMMATLLERSESAYMSLLEAALDEVGISSQDATRADLLHAFQALDLEEHYRRFAGFVLLEETLHELGIGPTSLPTLVVDAEPRQGKQPAAFAAPVLVPGEVYLVLNPDEVGHEHRALLSAAGHAIFSASVTPELDFAARRLGDGTIAEAAGYLLQQLALSPDWLQRFTEVEGHSLADYLRLGRFHALHAARHLAQLVLFEQDLHQTDPELVHSFAEEYANRLSGAMGVRYFPEPYLAHNPDGFTTACQARGMILGAILHARLRDQFGPRWFADSAAGQFLIALFSQGHTHDAEALAAALGYPTLSVEPLLADLLADALED